MFYAASDNSFSWLEFSLPTWLPPVSFQEQSFPQRTQDSELLKQVGFLPGVKELLMLRQVHALEHATVWTLSQSSDHSVATSSNAAFDDGSLGGMSTDQGFYLYGQVNGAELHRAVHEALRRITQGEWNLAVHPRCGTNLSVGMVLTAGLALGSTLLFPRGPIEQLVGFGFAAMTAAQLAPDVGGWVQQYVTTAVPFNLEIDRILPINDPSGRPTHFIRVRWIE